MLESNEHFFGIFEVSLMLRQGMLVSMLDYARFLVDFNEIS